MKVRRLRRALNPSASAKSLFGFAAVAAILSGPIQAANVNWDNGGGDFLWTNPTNWAGDTLPTLDDIAVMNVATGQNVFLNNSTQTLQGLLFNQAVTYTLYGAANTTVSAGVAGTLILNTIDQTANAGNVISPNVGIVTTNGGADILTSNVTANQLQLQGSVTAAGVTKVGAGILRLGTSGTAYNGAISGDIIINGGTFTASAANVSGVNNPIASVAGTAGTTGTINAGDDIIIGASGVTLATTHSNLASAGAAVQYDWGRNIIANNNSFTWNADRAAGQANSGIALVGTITLGTATLTTTTGNGFSHRTDGLILNPSSTTTISTAAVLQVDSLSADAASKIIKTGTSELRIRSGASNTNATAFEADFDLTSGTLTLQSDAAGIQPLGNANTQINITGANPTLSLRADAATVFASTPVFAGNNSVTYDVRPVSGSTAAVMSAGPLSIGTATLTVNGDRHTLALEALNQTAGSTTIVNINSNVNGAQNLRINAISNDANSVFRKTGGQTLVFSQGAANFLGKLEINGGTMQIEGATGNVPTSNSSGIQFLSSSTLNLRAAASTDFVSNISFGPNTTSSTISSDRLSGSLGTQTLSIGTLDVSASPTLGARTLTTSSGNSFILAPDAILANSGQATLNLGGDVTTPIINTIGGAGLIRTGGSTLTVTGDNTATWNTPTALRAGSITGTVAGSLGTGVFTVGSAASTAGFIAASRLNYNATGALGNATGTDVIVFSGGAIDFNATPTSADVVQVDARGRIQGSSTQLAQMNAGAGGNLILSADAIIVHETNTVVGGVATTVAGLDPLAAYYGNLYYGTAVTTTGALPNLGAGTPWKGVALETTGSRNVIGTGTNLLTMNVLGGDDDVATTEVYFQSMNDQTLAFGTTSGTDGTFAFGPASPASKYTIQVVGTIGTSTLGNVPGGRVLFGETAATSKIAENVDKILVSGGSLLIPGIGYQGGVPIEVNGNASLDIADVSGNQLDGLVTFKNGGVLYFNDPKPLNGTGQLTFESGGKLDISHANVPVTFFDAGINTQPVTFTGTGHTVRFGNNNFTGMDAKIPDAGVTYVISGGATAANFPDTTISVSTNTQTDGITIDGGVLTNDASSRGFNSAVNTPLNSSLTVAATRGTNLAVSSALTLGNGNLSIGSDTAIDNRDKNANFTAMSSTNLPDYFNSMPTVALTGAVTANDVTMNHSNLYLTNGGTQFTGKITNNGGVLYLDGGGSTSGTTGELGAKLAAGTLAPGGIFLSGNGRIEMGVSSTTSNGTRNTIAQAFVLNSDVHPTDQRSLFVLKTGAGSDIGFDFTNVTLNPGATLAINESGSDVRVSAAINGNVISSNPSQNTNFDYINLTRGSSADVNVGVGTPVVLQQGRLNITNWQGTNNTVSSVFGTIESGVQVDMIRGELNLTANSILHGLVRAQTAPVGGTSVIRSTSNSSNTASITDTSVTGTGRIELGRSLAAAGPEDMIILGTEVLTATAGQAPLHTHAGEIRIVNDGVNNNIDGLIRSDRVNDSDRTARVAATNVVVESGAFVQYSPLNNTTLTVTSTTFQGNGGIDVGAAGVTLGSVNAGTNTLTLQGTAAPTLSTPVTARHLAVNGLTMTVDLANVSGDVSVGANSVGTGASLTATGSVGGSLTVNSSAANLSGNVGNGLNVTTGIVNFTGTGTKTVSGPVTLDGGNIVATGTVDFGNTVLSSAAPRLQAGLTETRINGNVGLTATVNAAQFGNGGIRTEVRGANIASTAPELYVYSGQFFDADGLFTFAENFDDNVQLTVDGSIVLRNNTGTSPWVTATSTSNTGGLVIGTGVTEAGANSGTAKLDHNFGMGPGNDGWHTIEIRLYNGAGGGGPGSGQGWTSAFGFGLNASGTSNLNGANFIKPVDSGDGSLFRTTVASNLSIAANSTMKAGGMTNIGAISFSGANSQIALDSVAGPAVDSTATSITVASGGSGTLNVVRAGDSVTVTNLNLTGSLAMSGAGDFDVTGAGTGAGTLTKSGPGTLTINGSIAGSTTVNGGILQGSGSFNGLTVAAATIAPGNSPGVMTTTTLTAGSTSIFEFEIGSGLTPGAALAGTHYDQLVVTGNTLNLGGATLNLELAGGLLSNDVFTLVLNGGTDFDTGVFNGLPNGQLISLPNGYEVQISYFDDSSTVGFELTGGNDVSLLVTVPEPASAMTLLAGLGALAGFRRSRGRKA